MLINADCTIYEKETLIRHFIPDVYWLDARESTVTKNGVQTADSISVYLYSDEYIPKAGDILIKGNASTEFDCTSEKSESESKARLRKLYPDFVVIKIVNDYRFGGLQHIELTAR